MTYRNKRLLAAAEEIRRGIEDYADAQAEIGALILEHGNDLHERDFDKAFGGKRWMAGGMSGDSIILAPLGSTLEQYIHLAQLMMVCGLISAETRDGSVHYFIP